MEGWKGSILFPVLSKNATQIQKRYFAKISEVSKFFGGQPQSGINNIQQVNRIIPKLKIPKLSKLKVQKKKKREGC